MLVSALVAHGGFSIAKALEKSLDVISLDLAYYMFVEFSSYFIDFILGIPVFLSVDSLSHAPALLYVLYTQSDFM